MNLFKITDLKSFPSEEDYPLDEQDHPLDELDIPLGMQYQAELGIDDQFGLSDRDYDDIDNISPYIDKQMQDSSEQPEDGQYQDEWADPDMDQPLDGNLDDLSQEQDEFQDEELSNEAGEGLDTEDSGEDQEPDPDFQGVIRTVKGANLVYKRQMPDDTFAELWIMNIGRDMKKESQIKRAILAGTDVDPQSQESPDGKQHMELYSVGNVQFCEITGLSN